MLTRVTLKDQLSTHISTVSILFFMESEECKHTFNTYIKAFLTFGKFSVLGANGSAILNNGYMLIS
jgi:hypothetical protein